MRPSSTPFTANANNHRIYQIDSPDLARIRAAAADAFSTLEAAGVKDACLVGGLACNLFGNSRKPNDIDILCLTCNLEQEALKSRLVALNPKFYLVRARDSTAKYKVLWYTPTQYGPCIKVDILLPGVLDIPSIPSSSITRDNDAKLPCAPFSLVLLLKLQAWIHHGEALEHWLRAKQFNDRCDLERLLPIAVRRGMSLGSGGILPESFITLSAKRAERFVRYEATPGTRTHWEKLGLIPEQKPTPVTPKMASQGGPSLSNFGRIERTAGMIFRPKPGS